MSATGKDKRKTAPSLKYGEAKEKEQLIKTKNAMDRSSKKRGGHHQYHSKKTRAVNRQRKRKKKPLTPKGKTKEQKQADNREREEREKKKKSCRRRKQLMERDFNLLGQLSQLNKSVVILDEQGRELEEKEKELQRKKLEPERREKEVQNREEVANKEKQQNKRVKSRTTDDLLFDKLRRMAAGTSNRSDDEDGEDYAEEDFSYNLDDSGVDLTSDIDVEEAATYVRPMPHIFDRPTVGMKRPKTKPLHSSTSNKCPRLQSEPDCARCHHLLAEKKEFKQSNALLTEQLNLCRLEGANGIQQGEAPRPGKVSRAIAENHQMIELSPGKWVYVYESHITKAFSKKTACFLLSCLYQDGELIGKSLTGKNGKGCIDADILDSIMSYTRKKFPESSDSIIKISLRNKIMCLEAKSKRKTAV